MKILFLNYYFENDLGPAGKRNTFIAQSLAQRHEVELVDVLTTNATRWRNSPNPEKLKLALNDLKVRKASFFVRKSGILYQTINFMIYFIYTMICKKEENYDLVYASSSKLGTALIGSCFAKCFRCPLFLDLRDLPTDSIDSYIEHFSFAPLKYFLNAIAKTIFSRATVINVLSEGFKPTLKSFNQTAKITCFKHGVNAANVSTGKNNNDVKDHKVLLYAGNVGFGQGLSKTLPKIARVLPPDWIVKIYGDGSDMTCLKNVTKNMPNVKIHPPVSYANILKHYSDADVLLLTLNEKKAFELSLPSKIFDYAGTDKPIITFSKGVLNNFIRENNVPGVFVLDTWNDNQFLDVLSAASGTFYDRTEFITKWTLKKQVDGIVEEIIATARKK